MNCVDSVKKKILQNEGFIIMYQLKKTSLKTDFPSSKITLPPVKKASHLKNSNTRFKKGVKNRQTMNSISKQSQAESRQSQPVAVLVGKTEDLAERVSKYIMVNTQMEISGGAGPHL